MVDVDEVLPLTMVEAGPLDESMKNRPKGFLGKLLIKELDFLVGEHQSRDDQVVEPLVERPRGGLGGVALRPRDPSSFATASKQAEQRWNDPVGAGFARLIEGLTMINDDE